MCELVGLIVGWVCIIADSIIHWILSKTSWFDLQVWGFSFLSHSLYIISLPDLDFPLGSFLLQFVRFLDHPGLVIMSTLLKKIELKYL